MGADPQGWARRLGISREAVDIYNQAEVVDLHIESFVWTRVFGYDLADRHGEGALRGRFYSQVDLPRAREAGLAGAVFSIATNPFRRGRRRTTVLLDNLARLRASLERQPGVAVVADLAGYRRARAGGRLAAFVAVQGGNAFGGGAADLGEVPGDVVSRITLVHLSRSYLGAASAPGSGSKGGLTAEGRTFVQAMNERRILVDLAHASRRTFWDALAVHDGALPAIVSHTGVDGAHRSWRNVDDAQIRAIAEGGGSVGIMYHTSFLGEPFWSGRAAAVVRHLQHAIAAGGEDAVGLGSDWDGLIVPPRDLRTVHHLPVLVQRMLDAGFSPERIIKVLGANYLAVMGRIRPGVTPGS
ncbi:MAG: dipeptidase [Acidimicrobiales bacterium]